MCVMRLVNLVLICCLMLYFISVRSQQLSGKIMSWGPLLVQFNRCLKGKKNFNTLKHKG